VRATNAGTTTGIYIWGTETKTFWEVEKGIMVFLLDQRVLVSERAVDP
jgi:hypothetical protein